MEFWILKSIQVGSKQCFPTRYSTGQRVNLPQREIPRRDVRGSRNSWLTRAGVGTHTAACVLSAIGLGLRFPPLPDLDCCLVLWLDYNGYKKMEPSRPQVLEPVVNDAHRLASRVDQRAHMRLAGWTLLKTHVVQKPLGDKLRHRLLGGVRRWWLLCVLKEGITVLA